MAMFASFVKNGVYPLNRASLTLCSPISCTPLRTLLRMEAVPIFSNTISAIPLPNALTHRENSVMFGSDFDVIYSSAIVSKPIYPRETLVAPMALPMISTVSIGRFSATDKIV